MVILHLWRLEIQATYPWKSMVIMTLLRKRRKKIEAEAEAEMGDPLIEVGHEVWIAIRWALQLITICSNC